MQTIHKWQVCFTDKYLVMLALANLVFIFILIALICNIHVTADINFGHINGSLLLNLVYEKW